MFIDLSIYLSIYLCMCVFSYLFAYLFTYNMHAREGSATTPMAHSPEIHHTNDADSPDEAALCEE